MIGLGGSNAGLGTSSYPKRNSAPSWGVEGVEPETHLVPLPRASLGGIVMAGVWGAESAGLNLAAGVGVDVTGNRAWMRSIAVGRGPWDWG